MIEERLLEFGILGLWTISILIDKWKFQRDVVLAMNKLTKAIEEKF